MSRPDPDIALAAERLASGDPARWSAVLAAPVAARPVLIALGALNLELARAPWASSEPMVAEMRLQWWVDALETAGASGKPLPHEIGPAVQMALTAGIIQLSEQRLPVLTADPYAQDQPSSPSCQASERWMAASGTRSPRSIIAR